MALNDFLGIDAFDVKDDLDYLEYLRRPVFQRPHMRPRRPFVSATKRFYENAKGLYGAKVIKAVFYQRQEHLNESVFFYAYYYVGRTESNST